MCPNKKGSGQTKISKINKRGEGVVIWHWRVVTLYVKCKSKELWQNTTQTACACYLDKKQKKQTKIEITLARQK